MGRLGTSRLIWMYSLQRYDLGILWSGNFSRRNRTHSVMSPWLKLHFESSIHYIWPPSRQIKQGNITPFKFLKYAECVCVCSSLMLVLVLLLVALWFILRGDLLYVFPCVILFLCFSVLLVLRLPRLGKRGLILVLFVRLFGLCLFRFVGFLFLLGSGKGCGLWLWHSLDFSLSFFRHTKIQFQRRITVM